MTKLSFGTAGIRAPLGPSPDELNPETVARVAHALIGYLKASVENACERGLCIGFDGRTDSDTFAKLFQDIALTHGMRVRSFARVCPTPLLAFVTRLHDAAAGVMITASHNPPRDNGIKVYWHGGGQVLPPHDAEIARRIADEGVVTVCGVVDASLLSALGEPEVTAYLDAIERLLGPTQTPSVSLAYTALCGVGSELTRALLARRPVARFHEVIDQSVPRADFGGLTAPNPEYPETLTKVLELAQTETTDLAIAHDPDADRLAVAARDRAGALRVLSGDEIGVLLGEHMLRKAARAADQLLVSTVVSSEQLAFIARARGAHFAQALTGFKWIASRGRELERTRGLTFLYGYEEAIGYAFGQLGDDKDGIAALALVLELATELAATGRTLIDRLNELQREHGAFASRQLTFATQGSEGASWLVRAMAALRAVSASELLGDESATREDFRERAEATNLLVFRATDGSRICVRPSGTEPKLKVYLHARAEVQANEAIAEAQTRAQRRLTELEQAARRVLTLEPG